MASPPNSSGEGLDPNEVPPQRKKLVVVGDGFCGKTCMLYAFSKDEFLESYIPTVCETFVKEIEVNGRQVELVSWDTAGQEDYDRLRPVSYNRSHVVIVCFSVDDPTSYINVQMKWMNEIRHFCPDVPIILVATKLDLRYDMVVYGRTHEGAGNKAITAEEGARLAEHLRANAYLECSAKTREGIHGVFQTAAKLALDAESTLRKQERRSCEIC